MARLEISVKVDIEHQKLRINGANKPMPHKTWQVLQRLYEAAPTTVSRGDLIQQLWGERYLTGDKGLNQAIWHLRNLLNDNARDPKFIQTIPGGGYRWLPQSLEPLNTQLQTRTSPWLTQVRIAITSALFLLLSTSTYCNTKLTPETLQGAKVSRQADYLTLNLSNGKRHFIKVSSGKAIGAHSLSNDGRYLLAEVTDPAGCRMVEVDLVTLNKRIFQLCTQSFT